MIQVDGLTVKYGPIAALEGVSLQVAPGECVLVTGPSGCGKSTLGRVLTGLIPHALPASVSGSVTVAGLDVFQHPLAELAQQVGAVFQNPATQLFHLRVADEVAFGARNLGLPEAQVRERTAYALQALGLYELRERRPTDLSGGQKQRVAIAAALAMQPRVLVLDEPTASLDVQGTGQVLAALRSLRDELGITLVIIEHRLAEIAQLAERAVILHEGRLLADGPLHDVLGDRRTLRSLGLRRPAEEQISAWESLLIPNGSPPEGKQPLLEFQNVTAGYGRKTVIEGINLAFYEGDFAALVGENGAGKSTLALAAAGLVKAKAGAVRFAGGQKPRPGLDIALLFQNPADQLFTDSVEEEVAFGPQNYRRFDPARHEEHLARADLLALRQRRPAWLSVGQQQRTALAACLALQPRLVILDEPTMGQDWGHLQQLMDFLARLNEGGATILLITHDYKLVHRYARRVIQMEAGRIKLDGHMRSHREKGTQV
jgi:energy-coupling factor transport system ATP-binding protein